MQRENFKINIFIYLKITVDGSLGRIRYSVVAAPEWFECGASVVCVSVCVVNVVNGNCKADTMSLSMSWPHSSCLLLLLTICNCGSGDADWNILMITMGGTKSHKYPSGHWDRALL